MDEQRRTFAGWAVVEEWRPAAGFEQTYEVSNLGRVRRSGRAARHGAGYGGGARIGRLLKLRQVPGGYWLAQLWQDGRPSGRLVHRLVAATFLGPIPEGKEVNHIDGNKSNNCPENLEYLTRADNVSHGYALGLYKSGEQHCKAKLTEEQVQSIRKEHSLQIRGLSGYRPLGKKYGVDRRTIQAIINGTNWRHLKEMSHV